MEYAPGLALRLARDQCLTYRIPKTAKEIRAETPNFPVTVHHPFSSIRFGQYEVSASAAIGNRLAQEDRFTFCKDLIRDQSNVAFFGVFDGTVGDFASDTVKDLVVPHLTGSRTWPRLVEILLQEALTKTATSSTTNLDSDPDTTNATEDCNHASCSRQNSRSAQSIALDNNVKDRSDEELLSLLCETMDWMYLNADTELLDLCHQFKKNYASSTSVTVLLTGSYACVGHLGDSRAALGFEKGGMLFGEFLTEDHKPDLLGEYERIKNSGGSVEYLHSHNKPFIRGGDFAIRKYRGDQPMQLQYSRAFGGKDLKMYGLSNKPDIKVFKLEPFYRVLILASDGIWDVQTAGRAVEIVSMARREGNDPADVLVNVTLNEQRNRNQSADNLTVIVVFLDYGANYV